MPQPPVENQGAPSQFRTILLAADNKKSIIAELTGAQPNSIAYCAYGGQSPQQQIASHLGFNGELCERQIGWYVLGNGYRAYNPKLMRFHSPDSWSPFGGGGLNAYMYCVGDPVNFSDPTGHSILGVIKDFYSRNVSFSGASQVSINARHSRSISAGINRQEAMYALGQAGGSPSGTARTGQSSSLADIGVLVMGAPGPRGNNNPAIGSTGTTTTRNYDGYAAGAQRDGLTALGNRSMTGSYSQNPNLQAAVSHSVTRRQGMHKDSRGNIWVTGRDSNGRMVTRARQPIRGGGDATGTRPSARMRDIEIRDQAIIQQRNVVRQEALRAANEVLNARLQRAGQPPREILTAVRRGGQER
ncbi:RHS repeat-associated core domain-containing protein [Pseudomonas mandelii]|uniref:RHS repeat-associated core domain-containing protein n=1 Tax=Pseudomonas mandelii TaxID=75612 RepID=UPI00224B2DCD|nr:RHS repeat-associated core domain-containing protein [Pseudomonas mandelii]MCX2897832.1 RHS repeat-associated core domain-containing protein [Pseudomonas mandelii]